jgi:hypothetical protein
MPSRTSGTPDTPTTQQIDHLIDETVAEIAAANGRVIVGPWLGEVGFEVLYWIPFLRWLFEAHGIDTKGVTVVSRGGVEPWYAGLYDRYVDIFGVFRPEELADASFGLRWATGQPKKQVEMHRGDELVLGGALGDAWKDHALLHPSLLYRLFKYVWLGWEPMTRFLERASYAPWDPPDDPVLRDLPEDFTAVRFYFRESFAESDANRALVERIIDRLLDQGPVVLLNPGVVLDDHADAEPLERDGVFRPLAGVDPARNLRAQSAVLSRARLFVGTYGGLAHLAPLYRVPTVALATDGGLNLVHLTLARRVAGLCGTWLAATDGPGFDLVEALARSAR